jgi:hypothetical protein
LAACASAATPEANSSDPALMASQQVVPDEFPWPPEQQRQRELAIEKRDPSLLPECTEEYFAWREQARTQGLLQDRPPGMDFWSSPGCRGNPDQEVRGPQSLPGPSEPVVIQVNQQIEQEGIKVGVIEVALTGDAVTVSYWRDCGPYHLEPMDPAILLVAGEPVSGSGGGGGDPCDSSQVWQMTYPPLPAGVKEFSFRHGNIIGDSPESIVLELPLNDRLSALDPAFGGELKLDLVAESEGLAYRFTKLSMGIDRFTLDLEPVNESARDRPLGSPLEGLFIEDGLGDEYPGGRGGTGFQHPDPLTLVWEDARLEFRGHIDTQATTWQLRVPNLGKIYRGPWQFDIEVPSDVDLPAPGPTATPEPTLSPIQPVAVTPTATPGPDDPTRLMQALAMLPMEFSNQQILFGDFATSRTVTGLEQLRSMEDFGQPGIDIYRWNEGVPPLPSSLQFISELEEHTGWDLVASDLGIWGQRPNQGTGSTFLAVQGRRSNDTLAANLLALDFQPMDYKGETYYRLSEDYVMDFRHPLRTTTLLLNRVALLDDWLIAAPATGIMERLIDASTGESPTLLQSEPHRVLAETVGRGMVGGAFITPNSILETWNQYYGQGPVERLDRYGSGPVQWGRLSPYTLGFMGYRVQSGSEEVVIAFYYPNLQAAQRDAEELEQRWRTFHQSVVPSGPVEMPVSRYCSPLSTEVIEHGDSSVLVGVCPVIRDAEPGPKSVGPTFWTRLLEAGEMQFLARDLEQLRSAAEQRRASQLATQEALQSENK